MREIQKTVRWVRFKADKDVEAASLIISGPGNSQQTININNNNIYNSRRTRKRNIIDQ